MFPVSIGTSTAGHLVCLRPNRRRNSLSIPKKPVNSSHQGTGDYRFAEHFVYAVEILLGHQFEVYSRESNDLCVWAKLPYELERLVTVEPQHAAIEQDDLDVTNRMAEYAQSPRYRRRSQHIEAP